MNDRIPDPITDIQQFAQLLVAIAVELGEPRDTSFNDLPRLVREQRARITELERRDDPEWAEARRWAAWFAAERDQLRADRAEELAAIAEKQRQYRNRIAAEEQRAGEMARLAIAAQETAADLHARAAAAVAFAKQHGGWDLASRIDTIMEGR